MFRSDSIYKYYDGKQLTTNKDDVKLLSGELFEGHYYEIIMEELKEVNAGKYDYEYVVVIRDVNGHDITDNYEITYDYGIAEIKGADLVIKTDSDSKTYDGESLKCQTYTILSGELLNNDELSNHTGIDNCTFCHPALFICGNKTKEGAIAMAKMAVEN